MFVKTRKVKEGDGITIDPLGVIYRQTDKGLILEGLDEYSALLPKSGWYVEDYQVRLDTVGIGPIAFYGSHLKKVKLPDGLLYIMDSAFIECKLLEEVLIPDSVSFVSPTAFINCTSLRKISLPNNLSFDNPGVETNMGDGTPDFFLETSLDSLESILIPSDKRSLYEEQLPHLKHLFVVKK